ncbi:polysaccharide pyruvyl transferase family protein [Rhodococcus sp. NPDC060090]|uniref:polysaccharide pyruvyl transferase family protein n=1 Tax=Rhodococcus sp. NPDC060090 TaxID=3347056 RepID=UPI0036571AFF
MSFKFSFNWCFSGRMIGGQYVRSVFLSIAAAQGNLGDVFIRREITRAIERGGGAAVVYRGSMPTGYVNAFELPSDWTITSSPARFLWRLLRAAVVGNALIIMTPGPASLSGGVVGAIKRVGVACMIALNRIMGNRSIVLGRALRGAPGVRLRAEKAMAKFSELYTTRDSQSSRIVGGRAEFFPDLGFACLDPFEEKNRAYVGVSLRHDRTVDEPALKSLVCCIESYGLKPIFVTQVREDRRGHLEWAEALGVEHLDWPEKIHHSEQERRIEDCYSRCAGVVSDRLHVLILGARKGAIPVIVDSENEQKLHASLDEILYPQAVNLCENGGQVVLDLGSNEALRIQEAMASASRRLEPVLVRVNSIIEGA